MHSMTSVFRFSLILLLLRSPGAFAELPPMKCSAGMPLGRFDLEATPPDGGAPRPLQAVNRLPPGYRISYRPQEVDGLEKNKTRVSLVLAPSDGSKIVVFDPKPADKSADWTVPSRTQIAALVWGPGGLDKAKVTNLVKKNSELIGQLADYARKTEEAQSLIAAITRQQAVGTGQNVDAAVAGFANAYSSTSRIDTTQSTDAQMLALIRGVNPALSSYDPLAQDPQQRAVQTASLLAAVSGMFFGGPVGLAAEGGAVLVNMRTLIFPNTEFRSALAQDSPDSKSLVGLCGNKTASASRTELAFLWATRIPDAAAPEIALQNTDHAAIGGKSTLAIDVKGLKDPKLASRADGWKLVSADGKTSVPIAAKVADDASTISLDLKSEKLKPGKWKLAADWDWDPVNVTGEIVLHDFDKFDTAHLAPQSQDKLTSAAGMQRLELTGGDFEFVRKLSFKKAGDPFAQPVSLPFHFPDSGNGPKTRLETQLDAGSLATGDYAFLIAQADDNPHEVPFKVLPQPPTISGLPLTANTGLDSQGFELHGSGLDRIEGLSTDGAEITFGDAGDPTKRQITIKLGAGATAGKSLTLNMKVKDVAEPVALTGAILVTGPRPAISGVRRSTPGDPGIELQPDEMPTGSFVSFAMNVEHAPSISSVNLSCRDAPAGTQPLKIANNEADDKGRLHRESAGALFLSFNPGSVGQPPPGSNKCVVMATLSSAEGGESEPLRLGVVVGLPKIESFQLTAEKVGDSSYAGVLKGRDLEIIEKVGWDAQTGAPVDAVPSPVAGESSKESLRVVVPWPAPGPHAPLYIWLRGESAGRLTTATY